MKKLLLNSYRLAYLAPLAFASQAHAVSMDFPTGFAGFSTNDLKTTIQNIVRIIVGFLGIITIIIILAGGFKWMTSGGNEDKIGEAKKLISAGVVGLVVVLAAYAIASFVINSLQKAV
jgi:TRAP-type C4-dicarboxylate transport system permease small subunit